MKKQFSYGVQEEDVFESPVVIEEPKKVEKVKLVKPLKVAATAKKR